jgi:hypothetical protein
MLQSAKRHGFSPLDVGEVGFGAWRMFIFERASRLRPDNAGKATTFEVANGRVRPHEKLWCTAAWNTRRPSHGNWRACVGFIRWNGRQAVFV